MHIFATIGKSRWFKYQRKVDWKQDALKVENVNVVVANACNNKRMKRSNWYDNATKYAAKCSEARKQQRNNWLDDKLTRFVTKHSEAVKFVNVH